MKFLKNTVCWLSIGLLAASIPFPAAAEETYTYTVLEDGTAAIACADTSLTDAQIPAEIDGYTVTTLAEDAFNGCTALQTVTFPESLTIIKDYAFHDCEQLETIAIPTHITEIGSFVFEGCTALKEIEVSEENQYYCDDAGVLYTKTMDTLVRYPAAKASTEYEISDSCTTIAPWAFTECTVLQSVSMNNVKAIGADAFFCATSLKKVTLSDGIQELIGPTFAYCTNLTEIRFPDTLQAIGDNCFYGCVNLQNVSLPDGLLQIGEMAFYGCVLMKELTVPASVKSIGEMGIGYSVDPDTNENAVIEGFKMKTVSGSKAFSYAKRNKIGYSASISKTVIIIIAVVILLAAALGGGGYFMYRKCREQADALAQQKAAEKRERRRERKQSKH